MNGEQRFSDVEYESFKMENHNVAWKIKMSVKLSLRR
jgi:hypothetical protein